MLQVIGLALVAAFVAACGNKNTAPTPNDSSMSFFVSSARSTTTDSEWATARSRKTSDEAWRERRRRAAPA